MKDWQPMSTAPKDGRLLLLYSDQFSYPKVSLGSWCNDVNYPDEEPGWFDDSHDDFSMGYAARPLQPKGWIAIPEFNVQEDL